MVRLARKQADKQSRGRPMAQSKQARNGMSFAWGMPPMMTILADMNGTFLQAFAAAQKDWGDFVQRRISEDVAVARQVLNCRSPADMGQIYSRYIETAFQDYREQSEKVVQHGQSMAQHLAETTGAHAKEMSRAQH